MDAAGNLAAPKGIPLGVMNQVAAYQRAAVIIGKGNIQARPIDRHLHGIVDVVVLNDIVFGERYRRVLTAGGSNAEIGRIMDQIVGHDGVLGQIKADSGAAIVVRAAVVDVVVGNAIAPVGVRRGWGSGIQVVAGHVTAAGANPAAAQVIQLIALDADIAGPVSYTQSHRPHMGNSTIGKTARLGIFDFESRFDKPMPRLFLAAGGNIAAKQAVVAPGRQRKIDIFQGDPPEMQVFHGTLGGAHNAH
ncbi:MAG: hypothetical protein BWY71_02256 [Planctomycetes bacterium ADurb.Bin412]|nr:MAG: hypothetical protein BWY71_02256 [Planctomycetes bacterium ADurb.Bin412]